MDPRPASPFKTSLVLLVAPKQSLLKQNMSSQQSWAAWLLDSYASSVSPVTTDSPYRHHDESHPTSDQSYTVSPTQSSSLSSVSSISNSSAYGPYVRTGRGGAGNFNWQTDLKPAKPSSNLDLEAQQPSQQPSLAERRKAAARLENIDTAEVVHRRQNSAQFLSVGRGGAGNYASNSELIQAKRSPSLPVSLHSTKPTSPPTSYGPHPGRGGAGNYAAAAEATGQTHEEQQQQERLAAEQRREQIVVEVDGILQPPPGAWLGGRRKSESISENV